MRRHKHSLSHYVLSTFDMGQLVPIGHYEVLPGDSVRQSTSCLLRVSPLINPVMHPINVRIHHWYVPYRIIWPAANGTFEDFITGGKDGLGNGSTFPTFASTSITPGHLGDYLGVPVSVANLSLSMLPFIAYNRIWNENYRDQDLEPEVNELTQVQVLNCAWEKDYFTSARPWTQKGPAVTVPVSGNVTTQVTEHTTGAKPAMKLRDISGAAITALQSLGTGATGDIARAANAGFANTSALYPSNLIVQNANATINDFRMAFALQRYQEARAQYGSRFTEYLRYLGIRSSDARLQRPEYLGGGRATISFSEVLRTGGPVTAAQPIGEMAGHGISAMRSRRFVRFFEEHGIVMTLASIRPRSMYTDGLHRSWSKRTKEDYYQKELERVGQQPVFNREVRAAHATPGGTFGFQDRYSEYRHERSYVTGEFRSTLNDWHLARIFGSDPALNADFVKCVPSKRIHAEQTTNVLWGMFSHSIQARRMLGKSTIGRIF